MVYHRHLDLWVFCVIGVTHYCRSMVRSHNSTHGHRREAACLLLISSMEQPLFTITSLLHDVDAVQRTQLKSCMGIHLPVWQLRLIISRLQMFGAGVVPVQGAGRNAVQVGGHGGGDRGTRPANQR